LTRDHLDYHGDMQTYFRVKERLFSELLESSSKPAVFAVINNDDPYGAKMQVSSRAKVWRYGMDPNDDFYFSIRAQDFSHTRFSLRTPRGEAEVRLPLAGLYNVYNATAAIAVALAAGMSLKAATEAVETFPGVPGRLESIPNS